MNARIAVAQIDSTVGNIGKNVEHHVEFVRKALAKKSDIVVFPELSLTGYSVRDLNWDLALRAKPQPVFSELLSLSKKITILAGAVEEAENFGIYNSALVFEDGKVYSAHRKVYLPTYGMFEEMRYFNSGKDVRCFHSKHGKLGILICEDMWHLSLPYIMAHDGADVIIGMAASPTRLSGSQDDLAAAQINHEQHNVYARLLSTYVVWSNRVGFEDGVNFWGGAHAVDPAGKTIVQGKYFEEELIIADIKESEVRRARRFSRHFNDDSPGFTVDQIKKSMKRRR